jgi:hypothetical protein
MALRLKGLLIAVFVIVALYPLWAQTLDLAQPVIPATTSPALPTHAPDQVMWALIASYLMEYLKNANWFALLKQESSDKLKAQFGFLFAVLTAAGVHFAVTGSFLDGSGATVTVTGLSATVIKDVAFQWASQQGWYDLIVHKRSDALDPADVLTALNKVSFAKEKLG